MIYLLEDDDSIRKLVVYGLQSQGYEAQGFALPSEFWRAMDAQLPELLLLDIMLPEEDGLSILRKLRAAAPTRKLPVIILTAKNTEYDRVVGLDGGADDFISKPFGMMELLARVRAVLRRAQPVQAERKEPEEDGVVRVRGLWMDRKSMKARMDGVPMDLTALEFRILFGMAAHPGRVFTRENLLELAVGREFSRYDRSVDMHISTLRRKLGDDPHNPAYLKTIRGMGYTLLPEEA